MLGALPSPQNQALVRGPHAGEDLVGAALQLGEPPRRPACSAVAGRLAGQVAGDRLVEDVVRRRAGHELAAAPHQQIAVGHAGVELEAVAVERLAAGPRSSGAPRRC